MVQMKALHLLEAAGYVKTSDQLRGSQMPSCVGFSWLLLCVQHKRRLTRELVVSSCRRCLAACNVYA